MRKIKVNINRPQANPEQVAGLQQFDQMLSMYKKAKYLFYAKVAAIVTAVISVAAIAGYLLIVKPGGSGATSEVNKLSPDDPYASTMVESQYFELDASKDTVVEGANGTVIAIPAGAFQDDDGNVFNGKVKLEIAEAYTAADLIGGNITTDKNYGIQKALFVKATDGSKELKYNPAKPVIAEVPVSTTDQPQVILDGTRNDKGEMSWTSRGSVKKYLVTLPLAQLDFLPAGFEEEVQKHMPYRGREVADKALVDSLYYSIDAYMNKSTAAHAKQQQQQHEDSGDYIEITEGESGSPHTLYYNDLQGIRPSSIKALKEPVYENTFIATREFEQRLQLIFKNCDQAVLTIYLDHIHEDLWISDSLVAERIGREVESGRQFLAWSRQRLTNVKDAPATSSLLKQHYAKRQKQIENQLHDAHAKYTKQLIKEDKVAQQVRDNYSELLEERYEYRLEKFGIPIKENGTVAVAVILAKLPTFELKVTVNGGDQYDYVNVYIENPLIKSTFAMTSSDKILFGGAYPEDPHLLLWKHQKAMVIAVAHKGEKIYVSTRDFKQQPVVDIKLTLKEVSVQEYKALLKVLTPSYNRENSIEVDQAFQKKFYQEKQRQERLSREYDMIVALVEIACPCSFGGNCAKGEQIFNNNCKSCHVLHANSIGPDLAGISSRRSYIWIRQFIRNSKQLIKSGDPEAIAIYNKYGKAEMTAFPTFTDEEIDALLCYFNSDSFTGTDTTSARK